MDPTSKRQARLQAVGVRVLAAAVAEAHGLNMPYGGARIPNEGTTLKALEAVGIDLGRKRRR